MHAMILRRTAIAASRRLARPSTAVRTFSAAVIRSDAHEQHPEKHVTHKEINFETQSSLTKFEDVQSDADLLPPGGEEGTVPTDYVQATGLERLEILGKMQGIDIFDMRPLPSDRTGTMDNPIRVKSAGDEQYVGCTGCPADSHIVKWCTLSRNRPIERCTECGSVYEMEYVGPPEDAHGHGHHGHDEHHAASDGYHNFGEEPKTFADYVTPEYRYK